MHSSTVAKNRTSSVSSSTVNDGPLESLRPTPEQEEYAKGFTTALRQIYNQRGAPMQSHSQTVPSSIQVASQGEGTIDNVAGGAFCLPATVEELIKPDAHGAGSDIPTHVEVLAPTSSSLSISAVQQRNQAAAVDSSSYSRFPERGNGNTTTTADSTSTNSDNDYIGSWSEMNDDDDKRQRNRDAARRCREKRLQRQQLMRQQVIDKGRANARLRSSITEMTEKIKKLQHLLDEHKTNTGNGSSHCRLLSSSDIIISGAAGHIDDEYTTMSVGRDNFNVVDFM